jgi:hypothetical protein
MSSTIEAFAAEDITIESMVIKKGDSITVDKRSDHYLLLTPFGFKKISNNFVGDTIKVYGSILTHLE